MSNFLFDSWWQWRVCLWAGVCKLSWGIYRVVTCIFFGIISVFVWLWKLACRFISRNPGITLGGFLFGLFIVWLLLFAGIRAKVTGLEAQRDSISWEYHNFKESHGYE